MVKKTRNFLYICSMKRAFPGLLSLLVVLCSCTAHNNKAFFALDKAIEQRSFYDARYEETIQHLRENYYSAQTDSSRWEAAHELESLFYIHNIDSCARYILEMKRLQGNDFRRRIITESSHAQNLYRTDSLELAASILDGMDIPQIWKADSATRFRFCRAAYQVYRDVGNQEKFDSITNLWWHTDSTNANAIFNRDSRLRKEGQYDLAIAHLMKARPKSQRDSAVYYYYLGRLYNYAGKKNQAIEYFAKSAEYDMYVSGKTYESLLLLSRLLFDTGNIKRAERYMRIALTDVRISNWSNRYNDIIEAELTMMNALLRQEKQKRDTILLAMALALMLLLVVTLLAIYISRQSNRLARSEKNLQEVSKIKDGFLAQYMVTSVDYLNKVDEYRSSLRSTMKNEGTDAVKAMLRMPSFASHEFKNLLAEFDSTFLGIFPDFPQKVNELMQPEYRLEQPAPGALSTELRILALIKMGINKRQKIAKVLDMSVTTVYSYHSNLQKHSLHPDNTFDRIIAGL